MSQPSRLAADGVRTILGTRLAGGGIFGRELLLSTSAIAFLCIHLNRKRADQLIQAALPAVLLLNRLYLGPEPRH